MVRISYHKGRFDLLDYSKCEWLFKIETPHGTASVVTKNEPELPENFGVEDAVIEMRRIYQGFLLHTGRIKALEVCDKIMENLPQLELEWHELRTPALKKKAEQAQSALSKHLKTIEYLREEVAAGQAHEGV